MELSRIYLCVVSLVYYFAVVQMENVINRDKQRWQHHRLLPLNWPRRPVVLLHGNSFDTKKERAIALRRSLNNDSLNNDVISAKWPQPRRKCGETCVSIIGGVFGSIAGGVT
ncbi:4521_t:CDS:2, partial [Funneliformis geosporum]